MRCAAALMIETIVAFEVPEGAYHRISLSPIILTLQRGLGAW